MKKLISPAWQLLSFNQSHYNVSYTARIKKMGRAINFLQIFLVKGRRVQPGEGAFKLREAQSDYNAIFDHENRDIGTK